MSVNCTNNLISLLNYLKNMRFIEFFSYSYSFHFFFFFKNIKPLLQAGGFLLYYGEEFVIDNKKNLKFALV